MDSGLYVIEQLLFNSAQETIVNCVENVLVMIVSSEGDLYNNLVQSESSTLSFVERFSFGIMERIGLFLGDVSTFVLDRVTQIEENVHNTLVSAEYQVLNRVLDFYVGPIFNDEEVIQHFTETGSFSIFLFGRYELQFIYFFY